MAFSLIIWSKVMYSLSNYYILLYKIHSVIIMTFYYIIKFTVEIYINNNSI